MKRGSWVLGMRLLVVCMVLAGCKPGQTATVPNVVGQPQAAAGTLITAANLTVGAVTQEFSATVASGSVISQSPVPGVLVIPGTAVALIVSKGPQPVTLAVPNVAGQTQAAASAAVTGAGLTVGNVTQLFSETVAAGSVISQSPAAGALVDPGTAVALVVSRGTQFVTVAVPDVAGQTQADAQTAIIGAGLVVGAVTQEFSDTAPAGLVFSQSPLAGTPVDPGTAVALIVSRGPQNVAVPNVVGLTQAEAATLIAGANLTLGNVTYLFSMTVAGGSVISQDPAAGVSAASGTAVNLTVSQGAPSLGDHETVLLPGDVPLVMMWIPGGTFVMGSPDTEQDRFLGEGPQHSVTLDGHWMAEYELTKRQWTAVMGTTPWAGQQYVLDEPDSPAVYVSWDDAQNFLIAVSSYTGKTFSLPSESQWEYACRGGTTTRFYWGDDPSYTALGDYAWYSLNAWDAGQQYAHVVGLKAHNAFGLYDMSGNVYEWCGDDYHGDYVGAPVGGQAWVDSPRGISRVLRGGGWGYPNSLCRSANRYGGLPGTADNSYGLRVVRTP